MLSRVCSPGFRGNNLELMMKTLVKLFVFLGLILLIVADLVAWKIPAAWVAGPGQLVQPGYSVLPVSRVRSGRAALEEFNSSVNDVMLGEVKWDFMTI